MSLLKWFKQKSLEEKIKSKVETEGLKLKYSAGERFPWRGIWFKVSKVERNSILLIPESMTNHYAKELEIRKLCCERRVGIRGAKI